MELKDIKTLGEVAREYNISLQTLNSRISKLIEEGQLIEFADYKKVEGKRQPYILSKEGVEKIVKRKGDN